MKTTLRSIVLLTIMATLTSVAFAGGKKALAIGRSVASSGIVLPVDPAVDQNGNPIVDPIVSNVFCANGPNPVVDPNGTPVTYSQWVKATGSATMKCEAKGTRVTFNVTGLIPNALYTGWLLLFPPGGAAADFSNMIGAGALGAPDGSQNAFVTGANGSGQLSVLVQPSVLSLLPYQLPTCLVNDANIGEVQIHIAYHIDGHTYGGSLGPPNDDGCGLAAQLGLRFPLR